MQPMQRAEVERSAPMWSSMVAKSEYRRTTHIDKCRRFGPRHPSHGSWR